MTHAHARQNPNAPILPADKAQAINALIRVTQSLIGITERESQSLTQNDLATFAVLQDEKELVVQHYARASEEFRARINSYRGVDKSLLKRLEDLQNDLADRTRGNNQTVAALYNRSHATTQNALLAAQEMGQDVHVTFPAGLPGTLSDKQDKRQGDQR
jgi:uncharacterized membrane-anchored protein YhcB (DUF1043 family)